ncbi:PTB DOMAIN ENGULFMENT ADAPTER [Salix purpurea]|uniref:PTB DOMAIN ENGULFMENT ADAPTER n=1 Tax=Salix purpurea TaxID=77065 RepID=A0A9Q0P2W2_SALPP|nr:PTB DOMAIN ENGULFMENT ADAPTER [Salix purpurea]
MIPFVTLSRPERKIIPVNGNCSFSSRRKNMAALLAKATLLARGKDEVYVAATPLRATKGPAKLLMSTAYSLNLWDLQHFVIIIKPNSPPPQNSQATVFDFQPKDPENIFTALAVISGRAVPGAVLVRKLSKLPRSKCWFVGSSKLDAVDVATRFNSIWRTDLRVGHHDCRDYANGLVELLVGEKKVLERLRKDRGGRG